MRRRPDPLRVALRLVELGFSPVPIQRKKPLVQWREFQFRSVTADEVREWWLRFPDASCALLCGFHHDLVIVDSDSQEAETWCRENLPQTPRVVVTRRGFHRYYRHPGLEVRSRGYEIDGVSVDVKGDRAQCTAPGSVHPSGHLYEATRRWSLDDRLPILPREIARVACVRPKEPTKDRSADDFQGESIDRFRQYLAKHPIPDEGQGSDRATFNAAVFASAVDLDEESFVGEVIRLKGWDERWVRSKWRAGSRYGRLG